MVLSTGRGLALCDLAQKGRVARFGNVVLEIGYKQQEGWELFCDDPLAQDTIPGFKQVQLKGGVVFADHQGIVQEKRKSSLHRLLRAVGWRWWWWWRQCSEQGGKLHLWVRGGWKRFVGTVILQGDGGFWLYVGCIGVQVRRGWIGHYNFSYPRVMVGCGCIYFGSKWVGLGLDWSFFPSPEFGFHPLTVVEYLSTRLKK